MDARHSNLEGGDLAADGRRGNLEGGDLPADVRAATHVARGRPTR